MGGSPSRASAAFNGVVRCFAALRSMDCLSGPIHRIGLRSIITTFLIGAAVLCVIIMAVAKESSVNPFQQLPASAECADPQDVLSASTGLCQATNPWALAYLRGQGWANCAQGLPGTSTEP